MADQYHLRTFFGVDAHAPNMGLDVDGMFAEMEKNRYQYLSGPSVWVDPDGGQVNLTFVFQAPAPQVGR